MSDKKSRSFPKAIMIVFVFLIFLAFISVVVLVSVYYDTTESSNDVDMNEP
jgi:hypothetical protein